MAEIPVQKKSSLAWLWALLAILLAGLLLWWLFSEAGENEVADTVIPVVEAGTPVTDIALLLSPNAGELVGREVQLQGVPVLNVEQGRALLIGPDGSNPLLVIPQNATIPDGLAAGNMVDVAGVLQPMNALGQNPPALAANASGPVFVAASTIVAAGGQGAAAAGQPGTAAAGQSGQATGNAMGAAGTGATGTPPTPETVAAANRRALQRITTDPNATPRVYFPWDSAELTSGARAVLDQVIQSRANTRTGGITLVGFTDRSGPRPFNRELSEQRAESVRRYLAGKGIGANLIDVEAGGETPTLVKTGDGVREPLNRRVRIELSDAE